MQAQVMYICVDLVIQADSEQVQSKASIHLQNFKIYPKLLR